VVSLAFDPPAPGAGPPWRRASGARIVSESSTTTPSVSGPLARRPAAIAARFPAFGSAARVAALRGHAHKGEVAAADHGDQLGRAVRHDAGDSEPPHVLRLAGFSSSPKAPGDRGHARLRPIHGSNDAIVSGS
jgi:hypothetical protein